ncbi:TonB-dependent receptor [Parablastomonas sp. CN1-191]|uniref:TonB-dependent receptor n=1 Tax=Parablastomonas sp. CN1-191 TaxID=3400908 RepID=UPI003BF8D467
MTRPHLKLGVALAAIVLATPAVAQTTNPAAAGDAAAQQQERAAGTTDATAPTATATPTQAGSNGSQVEDIVVFGRKRSHAEELQSVPLSITALGPAQLQRSSVRDIVDVGRLTPNASLQSTSQRSVQNFSIRGTGVSGTSPSDEPAVGIFQDGVYWGSNYGALNELLDVEGVEILRGPQGTLFGRNVTGGAVTVRSARPTQTPYHRVTLGITNGLGLEASAVYNEPLSDTVSARIAVLSRANDGIFTNIRNNQSYGKTYVGMVRPSIKFAPSSNFDVTLLGEYYHSNGDPVAVRGISPRTVGATNNLAEIAGYKTSPDYSEIQVGDRGLANVDVYFGMAEANWHVGPGTFTSITGYRKISARNQTDYDGFPVNGFLQYVGIDQHQVSEELRYAADLTDWLSFTAGGYYFDQHAQYFETRDLNNHVTRTATQSFLDNSSYAFFAESDIKPLPALTLTLGGRYTHETKTPKAAAFGACNFALTTCTYTTRPDYSGSNFSPKVGLSYQASKSVLLFGSWTRGFRSGGFSLRGTPLGAPYEAEIVNAYEAGFKTDLLDRRVRFNVSAFYNKFDNLQRTVLGVDPVLGVVQSVFNAAAATVKGVEGELTVIPVTGLTLTGNYGYTDARYDRFNGVANFASLQFVRVPKHTAALMADYETEMASGDKIALHAGAAYTGKYFFDDPNMLSQPGYWLFDANVTYTLASNLALTAFSRNLTNTKYNVWGSTLGALGENRFPGDPRTYGLRVSYTF